MVENLKNNLTLCPSNKLIFVLRFKSSYIFRVFNQPPKDKKIKITFQFLTFIFTFNVTVNIIYKSIEIITIKCLLIVYM